MLKILNVSERSKARYSKLSYELNTAEVVTDSCATSYGKVHLSKKLNFAVELCMHRRSDSYLLVSSLNPRPGCTVAE
jgi:hypothetical protein